LFLSVECQYICALTLLSIFSVCAMREEGEERREDARDRAEDGGMKAEDG
jgi:hypothetical protein